ncbi:MAG: J domain-containing protein, partial [Planctomycetes bacterium]|nr:J domain-containing protein [Planctomycetota bacterium]
MYDDLTYYEVLGVGPQSDLEEIKRAFRRRALETHPDKNPHPQAGQEFIRVAQAYETLSDIHKRAAYDLRVLKVRSRTADYGVTIDDVLAAETDSILDSKGDDEIEEYIVGNDIPRRLTLLTFFRDLEQTEIFILFRDGKEAYHRKDHARAAAILERAVRHSPQNILYRYYHGLSLAELGFTRRAVRELKRGIRIGMERYPCNLCRGVRRALYDLHVKKGHRVRAWWMKRRQGPILFADPLTEMERERLRLRRMAYVESLKLSQ